MFFHLDLESHSPCRQRRGGIYIVLRFFNIKFILCMLFSMSEQLFEFTRVYYFLVFSMSAEEGGIYIVLRFFNIKFILCMLFFMSEGFNHSTGHDMWNSDID